MGLGGRNWERLEMAAVKAGNSTLVVAEVESGVARIDFLCFLYFQHYYLMLPHCHLGIVVHQSSHPVEPYWLWSVEMH
jgi:hypothetical protein